MHRKNFALAWRLQKPAEVQADSDSYLMQPRTAEHFQHVGLGLAAFACRGLLLLLAGLPAAQAAFVLTLDDLATEGIDVIVVDDADGGVGTPTSEGLSNTADTDGVDGIISFSGSVGSFILGVTTGISRPAVVPGRLHLSSVSFSRSGGTLGIMLSDTDFLDPASPHAVELTIGGTTDGTVFAEGFLDGGNAKLGMVDSTGGLHFAGMRAFAGASTGSTSATGAYSLAALMRITHTAGGQITSLNGVVTAVPLPGAHALMTSALVGLGAAGRRKRTGNGAVPVAP